MGPVGGMQYFILCSRTLSPSNQLWVWRRNVPGDNGSTSAKHPLRAISQPGLHQNSQSVHWLVKWPRVAPLIESAPPAAEWLPLPSSHADWITCHSSKLTSPQPWWLSMAQVYPRGVYAVHKYGNGTTFGTVSGTATVVPFRYSSGYIRNAVSTALTAGIHVKTLRLGVFEKHQCLFQRSYVKTFQAWSCQVLAFLKTADALSRSHVVFTQEYFANATTTTNFLLVQTIMSNFFNGNGKIRTCCVWRMLKRTLSVSELEEAYSEYISFFGISFQHYAKRNIFKKNSKCIKCVNQRRHLLGTVLKELLGRTRLESSDSPLRMFSQTALGSIYLFSINRIF